MIDPIEHEPSLFRPIGRLGEISRLERDIRPWWTGRPVGEVLDRSQAIVKAREAGIGVQPPGAQD